MRGLCGDGLSLLGRLSRRNPGWGVSGCVRRGVWGEEERWGREEKGGREKRKTYALSQMEVPLEIPRKFFSHQSILCYALSSIRPPNQFRFDTMTISSID
jgi:hypothetical protein